MEQAETKIVLNCSPNEMQIVILLSNSCLFTRSTKSQKNIDISRTSALLVAQIWSPPTPDTHLAAKRFLPRCWAASEQRVHRSVFATVAGNKVGESSAFGPQHGQILCVSVTAGETSVASNVVFFVPCVICMFYLPSLCKSSNICDRP